MTAPAPAPLVALLAGTGSPLAVGMALAGGLRTARGDAAAVVALLPGSAAETAAPAGGPARAAARRLSASLRLRGSEATAQNRLVLVRLAEDPRAAIAEVGRLEAACDVPVVVVLAGPRAAVHEDLLARCDEVVGLVSGSAPEGLASLARSAGIGHVLALEVSSLTRGLALAGAPVLAPLRDLGARLAEAS